MWFRFYIKKIVKVFYKILTKKENFKLSQCSRKDKRPYFSVLKTLNNHSPIIVDAVLQPNNIGNILCYVFNAITQY